MKFYNLKTRSHVEVPDKDVQKKKMHKQTKTGTQTRYAFTAMYEGTQLFKFTKESDFNSFSGKEI